MVIHLFSTLSFIVRIVTAWFLTEAKFALVSSYHTVRMYRIVHDGTKWQRFFSLDLCILISI